ncbi:hypothetical protein SK128_006228 [Halocaridina rubra]|uniref:Uncharacterized protein n=1 Tax=Halocaridina rubra TaxID=373956 RepID=A0AAN8WWC6_HALRR
MSLCWSTYTELCCRPVFTHEHHHLVIGTMQYNNQREQTIVFFVEFNILKSDVAGELLPRDTAFCHQLKDYKQYHFYKDAKVKIWLQKCN